MGKASEAKVKLIFDKSVSRKADEFANREYSDGAYERDALSKGYYWGYKDAEQDLGWHSVEESLPEMDEEVIVLTDEIGTAPIYKIAFGHIVDRMHYSDYNGWNIPGVKFWMPMPKIPEDK